jgi:hypothetical protein
MRRTVPLLVTSAALVATPLAAQTGLALAAGARGNVPMVVVNHALMAAALKPALVVTLTSDWPQLREPGGTCLNGGEETIAGTLRLTSGGSYEGSLQRRATVLFCGSHGPARESCELTLSSTGPVLAVGEVQPFTDGWTDPVLTLNWSTPDGAEVQVEGNCPEAFNEALRRMYAGVTHAVEFPVPVAGERERNSRLDDFGWLVRVR